MDASRTSAARRGTGALFGATGIFAVAVAAIGASGTRDVPSQLSYIATGGVVGVLLVVIGAALILADMVLRSWPTAGAPEAAATAGLAGTGPGIRPLGPTPAGGPPEVAARPAVSDTLVAVSGARRVHRSDCALVVGKSGTEPISPQGAADAELAACRVCEPSLAAQTVAG